MRELCVCVRRVCSVRVCVCACVCVCVRARQRPPRQQQSEGAGVGVAADLDLEAAGRGGGGRGVLTMHPTIHAANPVHMLDMHIHAPNTHLHYEH